jgi:hypothetical protein
LILSRLNQISEKDSKNIIKNDKWKHLLGQQAKGDRLNGTGYRQRAAGYGQQAAGNRLRAAGYGLRATGDRSQ